jgi:hypothetical protein
VDRVNHGSIRHVDTVVQRPVAVQHPVVAPRPVVVPHEPARPVVERQEVAAPRRDVYVHRDVDVDFHRDHYWNGFVYGRRFPVLPVGFVPIMVGGAAWYYNDGIYYTPVDGGYQEMYPPVGAAVPQLPDGAMAIDFAGQEYYYAGGAFYQQQPDGTYATVPAPLGITVPEPPPGATQTMVNGQLVYQFNGVYYQPVFANGVTQYVIITP